MPAKEITGDVYAVGSIDWDRRLFDELIPLPDGTSYNAYLVKGAKRTALIDTVHPTKVRDLMENLTSAGVGSLDYVVANHAEQDHSGSIPEVVRAFPGVKVLANPKCKGLLLDVLEVPEESFLEVADGETLDLGGRTLEFIYAPWVHWPETMFTYLREEHILFPCDLFGSHIATSVLFAFDTRRVYGAAKRYYAEIMMPFRSNIQKYLNRLAEMDVRYICPSHGPVYDKPAFILDAYRDWVSDAVTDEVVAVYVSMYGSTYEMVRYLTERLIDRRVSVKLFNLTKTDIGELAKALVDAATLVVGVPTLRGGPHPAAVFPAHLVSILRPKTRFVGIIGSYGWGSNTVQQLTKVFEGLGAELLNPVYIKGYPKEEDYRALDSLADAIRARHDEARAKPVGRVADV